MTNTIKSYKILFVEDVETDVHLAERCMRSERIQFTSFRVDTKEDLVKSLSNFNPDIVISDYSMPGFSGMDALSIVKKTAPDLPVIFLQVQ